MSKIMKPQGLKIKIDVSVDIYGHCEERKLLSSLMLVVSVSNKFIIKKALSLVVFKKYDVFVLQQTEVSYRMIST